MNETIKLILSLSLSGSILAVLIFALKPFIKHKLSKSIQYYIWIVVVLRLLLPFSFEGSAMNNVFYVDQTPVAISIQSEENASNPSILPNVQENVTNDVYNGDVDHSRYFRDLFNQYVIYLWLLGIIIALTVNLTGYTRFSKYLKQANKPATDEENRILATLLNGRNNVRLVRNRFSTTPMLIGILRPYIIIPDINFNEKQLKNILLHEIAHLKHFDIGVKWLTMIATSIHWFNPLMYFIKKEINHACELACDEAVIKDFNPTEKQAYGDTLISVVAEHRYPIGVLQATLSEGKETLKERLVAIMKYNKKSKSIMLISMVLLIVVISGAMLFGAYSGKSNKDVTNEEKAAVASIVEGFGSKLQMVSLSDPKDIVEKSMQDNYGTLASQALIKEWISGISDPLNVPGRLTSSSWPDRIEILSTEKLSADEYKVSGKIIEMTSVEKLNGGIAAKRPITLAVRKIENRWIIDDVTLGAYEETDSNVYQNTQYGFNFSLPESWKGYIIVTDEWKGVAIGGTEAIETGPLINIRHPKWTTADPWQDIPIMIFTLSQWESLQQVKFHIGAAPIGPSEIGRNSSYVFALPARYNYAFPTGWEEVENILNNSPLQPTEDIRPVTQ